MIMPCLDGGPSYEYELQARNNRLEAFLCEACNIVIKIYKDKALEHMSCDLREWWLAHEAEDNKRRKQKKEQERLAKLQESALGKLTTAEVEALRELGLT
jgi:hypothetical protein